MSRTRMPAFRRAAIAIVAVLAMPSVLPTAVLANSMPMEMVQLSSNQVAYHMDMDGADLEVFEGTFVNTYPESAQELMLLVTKRSHADGSIVEQDYVPMTDAYVVSPQSSGQYRLELPMTAGTTWEVTGPFAQHGSSPVKALRAHVETSSVDAMGVRHYFGTVTNDSSVNMPLASIAISAPELVNGALFGVARDESLAERGIILAPNASAGFELVGMRPGATATPVLGQVLAQGRYESRLRLSGASAPSYGTSVKLTAVLDDPHMAQAIGSQEVSIVGDSAKTGVADTKSIAMWNDSSYAASVSPRWGTAYRAYFAGNADFAPAVSSVLTVKPKVSLTTPLTTTTQTYGRSYVTTGYLKPGHSTGSAPIRIYRWRYVGGAWKSYGYVTAKLYGYGSSSKYSIAMKLPARGKWRISAVHPTDAYHSLTKTSYRYIAVR